MRCPDCAKFVSMETEVEDTSVSAKALKGKVVATGSCRVVRNCSDCSQTLKSTEFQIDCELEVEGLTEGTEVELDDEETEVTESGGGRYAKNMIGIEYSANVKVGDKTVGEIKFSDDLAAGQFDEEV